MVPVGLELRYWGLQVSLSVGVFLEVGLQISYLYEENINQLSEFLISPLKFQSCTFTSAEALPPETTSGHTKLGYRFAQEQGRSALDSFPGRFHKRQSCSRGGTSELLGWEVLSVVWVRLVRIPDLNEALEQTGSLSLENLSPPEINSW